MKENDKVLLKDIKLKPTDVYLNKQSLWLKVALHCHCTAITSANCLK